MPANRTAGIAAIATTIVGALITLLGAIDDDTAKAVVLGVAILAITAVVITFMRGSQQWDSIVMTHEPSVGPDSVKVHVGDTTVHDDAPDVPLEDAGELGEVHEDNPDDDLEGDRLPDEDEVDGEHPVDPDSRITPDVPS